MLNWSNARPLIGMTRLLPIAMIAMSVTGCGMFTRDTIPSDCCIHLEPVFFSADDTEETQRQVIDYLITYEALCGGLDGQ
jgi:hypothetical protein